MLDGIWESLCYVAFLRAFGGVHGRFAVRLLMTEDVEHYCCFKDSVTKYHFQPPGVYPYSYPSSVTSCCNP